jgi:hypothetical protein
VFGKAADVVTEAGLVGIGVLYFQFGATLNATRNSIFRPTRIFPVHDVDFGKIVADKETRHAIPDPYNLPLNAIRNPLAETVIQTVDQIPCSGSFRRGSFLRHPQLLAWLENK